MITLDYLREALTDPSVVPCAGLPDWLTRLTEVRRMIDTDEDRECLGSGDGACSGAITSQRAAGGTCMVDRCDHHWNKHYEWLDQHNRNYPDTDTPPEWFDPTYAGEHWGDDY